MSTTSSTLDPETPEPARRVKLEQVPIPADEVTILKTYADPTVWYVVMDGDYQVGILQGVIGKAISIWHVYDQFGDQILETFDTRMEALEYLAELAVDPL